MKTIDGAPQFTERDMKSFFELFTPQYVVDIMQGKRNPDVPMYLVSQDDLNMYLRVFIKKQKQKKDKTWQRKSPQKKLKRRS